MNKKFWTWLSLIVLVVLIFVFVKGGASDPYSSFATCLSDNGVKMFGAYWCPHCQDQKKLFSGSWEHVNYVECSLPNAAGQTQECTNQGIQSYPTWEFADGNRISGVLSLEQLSSLSGCELVIDEN